MFKRNKFLKPEWSSREMARAKHPSLGKLNVCSNKFSREKIYIHLTINKQGKKKNENSEIGS